MNLRKTHITINKKVIEMDYYDKDLEQALINKRYEQYQKQKINNSMKILLLVRALMGGFLFINHIENMNEYFVF